MMEVFHAILTVFEALPFSGASWFVILTMGFFVLLFARANNNPKSPIAWEDLIVSSPGPGRPRKVSPYKMGYLIGCIVGTWLVVQQADTGKLTFDIFGDYLMFLLGGAGMSNYFKNKGASTVTPPPSDSDSDKT